MQQTPVPYQRARSNSLDSILKAEKAEEDPYEHLDTSDDEQAVHNTGNHIISLTV